MEGVFTRKTLVSCVLQLILSLGNASGRGAPCRSHSCQSDVTASLNCSDARILISDVTSGQQKREPLALESLKRTCMGNLSCDSSRVCGREGGQGLTIHYVCVDAGQILPQQRVCGRAQKIQNASGYIQSPGYPSPLSRHRPCRWRLSLSKDDLVVITLHDVHTNGSRECDGGLMVSGHACDGEGHAYAPRLLCGGDAQSSFIRCGKVDIGLSPSEVVYPLRFWLSFHVQPRHNPSSLSVPRCPAGYSSPVKPVVAPILPPGRGKKETNMVNPGQVEIKKEMLVILLSIFSGISMVLFIILIVVCIRCHPLQSPHPEPVSRTPSPGLQAHIDYMSVMDSDKARPQLADGYFEVADALPMGLRHDNLPSPAYAEVEQFAPLHKGAWHPYSEPDNFGDPPIKGGSPAPHPSPTPMPSPEGGSRSTNCKGNYSAEIDELSGRRTDPSKKSSDSDKKKSSKKRVLDRFRGDRSRRSSNDPIDPQQLKHPRTQTLQSPNHKGPSIDKNGNDSDTSVYEDCTSYGYEPIEFPKSKHSSSLAGTDKVSSVKSSPHLKHPEGRLAFSEEDVKKETSGIQPAVVITNMDNVKNKPLPRIPQTSLSKDTCDGKQSQYTGTKQALISGERGRLALTDKSSPRHLRVPRTPKRDVPQTRGIVKNGIKLFERQDAMV